MTTLTRQHGTKCHTCPTLDDFVTACQDVLENHSYAKANDVTIDSTTAGMVHSVWKALNEKNKELTRNLWLKKHAKHPGLAVSVIVKLFWKCCK